ncbi:MAG: glutamate synthase (NADPH/NADH) large chain, partial [Alteromonadaceae bacterium]
HPPLQLHLQQLIQRHFDKTGSDRAKQILADFDNQVENFSLIKPKATTIDALVAALPTTGVQYSSEELTIPVREC